MKTIKERIIKQHRDIIRWLSGINSIVICCILAVTIWQSLWWEFLLVMLCIYCENLTIDIQYRRRKADLLEQEDKTLDETFNGKDS